MNPRAKKFLLLLLAAALLVGAGQVQQSLNRDRDRLGLTHAEALSSAPPMLAFTTVALGGFRGLISNYLWIRANDLQQDDKFFEATQLADWITDLEPHFSQVWIFQAWNMAFNISVKFKDFSDRWRWLNNGIELLRDRALRYNPDDVPIHRELAWFFQFKMGDYLDDANRYYKQQWAEEMTPFFGPNGTNFEALIHPETPEEQTNVFIFTNTYKIDPFFAQKVDEEWGPLDWRLPEAHAMYWAALGLDKAKKFPDKVNKDELIQLRRVIYQSTLQAFHHGRIIVNSFTHTAELAPNLDLAQRANDTYLAIIAESNPGDINTISTAHRNFLRDAVKYLYENNRVAEAAKWYKYLGERYPNKTILDKDPNSYPRNLTLEDYVFGAVQEAVGDTSKDATTGVIEGMLTRAYTDLVIGQDARAAGYQLLAKNVYDHYQKKIGDISRPRVGLDPMDQLKSDVLSQLLDPKDGLPYAARLVLRTKLGMPAETNVPPASVPTNSVAPPVLPPPTNAVPGPSSAAK